MEHLQTQVWRKPHLVHVRKQEFAFESPVVDSDGVVCFFMLRQSTLLEHLDPFNFLQREIRDVGRELCIYRAPDGVEYARPRVSRVMPLDQVPVVLSNDGRFNGKCAHCNYYHYHSPMSCIEYWLANDIRWSFE